MFNAILELKDSTAASMISGLDPGGNASLESLKRGWGIGEYLDFASFVGRHFFFLLFKSKCKPFLFPFVILMILVGPDK